jgi:hypothetical protein
MTAYIFLIPIVQALVFFLTVYVLRLVELSVRAMCYLATASYVFIAHLPVFCLVEYTKDLSSTIWTGSVKYLTTKEALIYMPGRPQINLFMAEILYVIGFIFWWKIGIPLMVSVVHMASLLADPSTNRFRAYSDESCRHLKITPTYSKLESFFPQ